MRKFTASLFAAALIVVGPTAAMAHHGRGSHGTSGPGNSQNQQQEQNQEQSQEQNQCLIVIGLLQPTTCDSTP